MSRIVVPSRGSASWQELLADPEKHWKAGYSAMALAQSWEAARDRLPPEIGALLNSQPSLNGAELVLALPEHKVDLPGGARPTQTDVFALVRTSVGLSACAIEGKVDEDFGPTIDAKRADGAADRLRELHDLLEIAEADSGPLRYQLFHRTAAAILLAIRFHATSAIMIVHSFSQTHSRFSDFEAFGRALGVEPSRDVLTPIGPRGGVPLFLGWATGDQRFRQDLTKSDS